MTSMEDQGCPFCGIDAKSVWLRSDTAIAIRDAYPVAPGHTLIIPTSHVGSLFDLPTSEVAGVWQLAAEARNQLKREFRPDGFNVGVNDGEAAGQTVVHAHVHVIPRFGGDVADPRGGIRWVIPDKAPYWTAPGEGQSP